MTNLIFLKFFFNFWVAYPKVAPVKVFKNVIFTPMLTCCVISQRSIARLHTTRLWKVNFDRGLKWYKSQKRGLSSEKFAYLCVEHRFCLAIISRICFSNWTTCIFSNFQIFTIRLHAQHLQIVFFCFLFHSHDGFLPFLSWVSIELYRAALCPVGLTHFWQITIYS